MNMMTVMKESDNSSGIKSLVKKLYMVMNILLLLLCFSAPRYS